MAVTRHVEFADTTEQITRASACYLHGVYIANPARTATDGWIELYNASGVTPGTTEPDFILHVPFGDSNKYTYRFTFPRIFMATGIEVFFNDTSPVDASAWNGTGATGYYIDVYWSTA